MPIFFSKSRVFSGLLWRGRLSPHVQTVSTSLMSKLVKIIFLQKVFFRIFTLIRSFFSSPHVGVYKGKLLFFGVAKRVVIGSSGDFLPDLFIVVKMRLISKRTKKNRPKHRSIEIPLSSRNSGAIHCYVRSLKNITARRKRRPRKKEEKKIVMSLGLQNKESQKI